MWNTIDLDLGTTVLIAVGLMALGALAVAGVLPRLLTFAVVITGFGFVLLSWLLAWSDPDLPGGLGRSGSDHVPFARLMFSLFAMLLYFVVSIALLKWWAARQPD